MQFLGWCLVEFNFAEVMNEINQIAEREQRDAEELVEEMAEATLNRVREKSPVKVTPYEGKRKAKRKAGAYKKGWSLRTELKYGSRLHIISNDKEPELTHILEFGTAMRTTDDGKNRGRVPKQPHIRAAFDEVIAEYEKK